MTFVVPGVGVLALTAGMFVETGCWWLRGLGPPKQLGLYISRSNILAYAMRAFLVFYNALISFFIEMGARPRTVALVLGISFVLAGLSQIMLASRSGITMVFLKGMTRLLRLPDPEPLHARSKRVHDKRLFGLVSFSTTIFSLGMTLPLLVAVLVPQFRLSISYLGQIINIVGMIVVLFYIDQQLFSAMDKGTLLDDVTDYTYGRMFAFLLTGAAFLAATTIEGVIHSQPLPPPAQRHAAQGGASPPAAQGGASQSAAPVRP